MAYRFTVTKTYNYHGYPEAQRHYEVKGDYFTARLKYFGNHGWDAPEVNCRSRNNGYFWSLHKFMKALYGRELDSHFYNLKENESMTFTIED